MTVASQCQCTAMEQTDHAILSSDGEQIRWGDRGPEGVMSHGSVLTMLRLSLSRPSTIVQVTII